MKDIMLSSLCLKLTPGMRRNASPVTVTEMNWLRDTATPLIVVSFVKNYTHTHIWWYQCNVSTANVIMQRYRTIAW